ncbi:hypothetical protein HDV57DRAFT_61022 [Trichoderma longibrachiatum]
MDHEDDWSCMVLLLILFLFCSPASAASSLIEASTACKCPDTTTSPLLRRSGKRSFCLHCCDCCFRRRARAQRSWAASQNWLAADRKTIRLAISCRAVVGVLTVDRLVSPAAFRFPISPSQSGVSCLLSTLCLLFLLLLLLLFSLFFSLLLS